MSRILVDPDTLQSLASQFDEASALLQALARRSGQSLAQTDWVAQSLHRPEAQIETAERLGATLSQEAVEFSRSLRQTAERFIAANAWRPAFSATAQAPSGGAGPATDSSTVGLPSDPMAILNAYFPGAQRQAILAHVVEVEGMGGPSAAHGAVVSRGNDGLLYSDGQWLNFGYISFAMPNGTGDEVLQRIFATPGEEEAFRAIALRHLQDRPAGQVPDSHSHLLRQSGTEIPASSASAQADQFIALVKAGDQKALADWFFKYGNDPVVERGVASGHLRPEWGAVMSEFLGRPASVEAQLERIKTGYLDPAIQSANRFGLHSTMGVAWFMDQHVQSGSPKEDMEAMLEPNAPPADSRLYPFWQRYQEGTEQERLRVLTELSGSPGSDVRVRREAVLNDTTLTMAPFADGQ